MPAATEGKGKDTVREISSPNSSTSTSQDFRPFKNFPSIPQENIQLSNEEAARVLEEFGGARPSGLDLKTGLTDLEDSSFVDETIEAEQPPIKEAMPTETESRTTEEVVEETEPVEELEAEETTEKAANVGETSVDIAETIAQTATEIIPAEEDQVEKATTAETSTKEITTD